MPNSISCPSESNIIHINERFSSGSLLRSLSSVYASYLYYDTPELQITSVFLALIKGHYFTDGNKRTAVAALLIMCMANGIKPKWSDSALFKIAISMAKSSYDVEKACKYLFG